VFEFPKEALGQIAIALQETADCEALPAAAVGWDEGLVLPVLLEEEHGEEAGAGPPARDRRNPHRTASAQGLAF
jgi:hypothetical protein